MLEGPNSNEPGNGGGFALTAALLGLVLLAGLALAMVSLAGIEIRRADRTLHEFRAKENARLALVLAIGQLQRTLGPDTRISASSSLLSADGQQHWTGVWSTRDSAGNPWITRDPTSGGLTDRRLVAGYDRGKEVMEWLVSGSAHPDDLPEDLVQLVGPGSVADPLTMGATVPALPIKTGNQRGKLAWWTGDLAQRANLTSPTAGDLTETPPIAAKAAPELIGDGISLPPEAMPRLVSNATITMAGGNSQWSKTHFHDFTVHSRSLLTDVRNGGLKKDLSAWFHSDGVIEPSGSSSGLADSDRLAGPANEAEAEAAGLKWEQNPFRKSAPRFGLLRQWAMLAAPRDGGALPAVSPETLADDRGDGAVLANSRPVALDGNIKPSVQPILVEASQYHSFSWYKKPGPEKNHHHLRKHIYPRFVLWNPYPVPLMTRPMMAMLQINGRHDFWIDGYFPNASGKPGAPVHSPWVAFDGGRSRDFIPRDHSIFSSPAFTDPHVGSYYYQIPATRFEPGECLVFSPPQAAIYQNGISEEGEPSNLAANLLTTHQPPHPERPLTIPSSPDQPAFEFIPTSIVMESTAAYFALFKMDGISNPADDLRVILKDLGDEKSVDVDTFDKLPQLTLISGSLQYGAGREPGIPWQGSLRIPIEETTDHPPRLAPDGRSREGLRLRTGRSCQTAATEAVFANWNPRASYSLRSPRGRFHQAEGRPEFDKAAWGFGIYERFMPTADAGWSDEMPGSINGSHHLHPLDHESDITPVVLFDIPREGTGVFSMGHLQHAPLSNFVWHPSRVIGNSLADPRVGSIGTLPARLENGGFTFRHIGGSAEPVRSNNPDAWAEKARAVLQNLPEGGEELVYDISYEVNHALWDPYFLSGADPTRKAKFVSDPLAHPLPNPRLELATHYHPEGPDAPLLDFHKTAFHLTYQGAFNVNSVSVDAWAAVLAGTRRATSDGALTPFSRIPGSADPVALTDIELKRLASAVVAQVKLRGPFLGMADFVNRRLAPGKTDRCGVLEAALEDAGINAELDRQFPLDSSLPESHPPEISAPLGIDVTLKPKSTAWGHERFLTQGDILQTLGDSLVARSDTFIVRAYGESTDRSGKPAARAWCEAVVQRISLPVTADASGMEPAAKSGGADFGRQFRQIRFRWLAPSEI